MAGFSIYHRNNSKGKPVFYVRFKQADGTYSTAKSTGQATRKSAREWAEDYLTRNGGAIPGRNVGFKDYSEGFFDFNGRWATDKKSRGLRISERHCLERTDLLNKHLVPYFKNLKLTAIDRKVIKDFRNSLYVNGYSGSTINKCLSALKAIMESAEEHGIVNTTPRMDRAADIPKIKGILTIEEVHALFNHEWTSVEAYRHPLQENLTGKAANRLAASTGLRAGEIRGLVHADINMEGGYITVRRSFDNRLKKLNTTTKTGRSRNIFIPPIVQEDIKQLMALHPDPSPEAFVFFSAKIPAQPTAQRVFTDSLYKALREIGIDETQRRARNITFHSWRGFMNSLMINSKIPIQKVMKITGHLTADMVEHYYRLDDMSDVRQLQESLFEGVRHEFAN